jgi:hypothetical protein
MATCVCVFSPEGNSGVSGALKLSQTSEDGPTVLEGQVRGLTANQRHGISVCTYGDVRDGAASCGPIFNPFGTLGRQTCGCAVWCCVFVVDRSTTLFGWP